MPPKKRTPKTAIFCIRDVIDQPLHVLGNAISALRGRPTPLARSEAMGVASEGAHLLSRAVASINAGLVHDVLPATLALILDGIGTHAEVEAAFVSTITAAADAALRDIDTIFDFCVVRQSVVPDVQIDVLEIMQSLCDAACLKDAMGARFMLRLAKLLGGPQVHFALHRALCTAIINLVKCSKANKLLLPSYTPVCVAFVNTTDYFFQLQCMEVLYRVSRQNPRLLDDVRSALPPSIFDGIRKLTNNDLFESIAAMLDVYNESCDPRMILRFPVKRCDVVESTLTEATKAYFSPEFLIIFVPKTAAENITIEYSCIRSVRVPKDGSGRVIFRLREPPACIASQITVGEEGKDTLILWLDAADLNEFKESKLHSWLISAIREAASAASGAESAGRLSHNRSVSEATARVLAQRSRQQGPSETPHHHPGPERPPRLATPAVALKLDMNTPSSPDMMPPTSLAVKPSGDSHGIVTERSLLLDEASPLTRRSSSYPPLHGESDCVLDVPSSSVTKRCRTEIDVGLSTTEARRQQPSPSRRIGAPANGRARAVPLEPIGLSPPPAAAVESRRSEDHAATTVASENNVGAAATGRGAAAAATGRDTATATGTMPGAEGHHVNLEGMLSGLRDAVEAQTRAQKQEAMNIISDIAQSLQAQVTSTRAAIEADREAFQKHVSSRIQPYTEVALALREQVDAGVERVNDTSAKLRQGATSHRESLAALEAEFRSVVPRLIGLEGEELRSMQRRVDSDLSLVGTSFHETLTRQPAAALLASVALSGGHRSWPYIPPPSTTANESYRGKPDGGKNDGRLTNSLARVYVS